MSTIGRRAFVAMSMAALSAGGGCRGARAAVSAYDPTTPDLQFAGLVSPFDVAAARSLRGEPATDLDCDKAPKPVTVLDHESKYKPGTNSSVEDSDREEDYQEKLKEVSGFYNPLTRISDRYVRSQPRASEIAQCALHWLSGWAQAGALEKGVTEQGRMVQAWALASLAGSYLKIRSDPYLSPSANREVLDWLGRLNGLVIANFDSRQDKKSRSNNHRYWANWAVCATAIAQDDAESFAWAKAGFERACAQVEPDGVLPLEMERRRKALHYHNFALGPLVLHAEALIANGQADAYGLNDGAVKRLAGFVVSGLRDPAIFAERAGEKQDLDGTLKETQLAWMEPYYARFKDESLTLWMKDYRPLVAHRLGGDLTLLFGAELA
ncbi:alginate lyase family protein [Asticcacaulis sp. AC460]|uniref:alginate lyase family protein n=1 Tax=Asticcacaulis sp. AC460 TaxID=1282360 RepID=UPI00138AD17E|nr:alginate lyase family protein [Asticcacaulis sp. AC460]